MVPPPKVISEFIVGGISTPSFSQIPHFLSKLPWVPTKICFASALVGAVSPHFPNLVGTSPSRFFLFSPPPLCSRGVGALEFLPKHPPPRGQGRPRLKIDHFASPGGTFPQRNQNRPRAQKKSFPTQIASQNPPWDPGQSSQGTPICLHQMRQKPRKGPFLFWG